MLVPSTAERILHGLEKLRDQANASMYHSLLELCWNSNSVSSGRLVHDRIFCQGLERDGYLQGLVVKMYCTCDALDDAIAVFSKTQTACDVSTWNVVMKTLDKHGEREKASKLFERMETEAVLADKVTCILMMTVCASLGESCKGTALHASYMDSVFASDIVLETSTMNMYAKCGRLADAKRLFDYMTDKNVITWTTFITAHSQHNKLETTLQLFHQMHQEGQVPNRVTYVNTAVACAGLKDLANGRRLHILILSNEVDQDLVLMTAFATMYGACMDAKNALESLYNFQEWNLVTWNTVVTVLMNCGQAKEAFGHFLLMQQHGMLPDKVTFLSVVDACANPAFKKQGCQIHAHIVGTKFNSDIMLNNALINMCSKFDNLVMARQVFEEMLDKNVVSWNTIITAYAQRKTGKNAFQLFYQMQLEGILSDKVSLYGYLDACGAQQDFIAGVRMHACLLHNDTVPLDAFLLTAIVTMYGKCGNLECANDIFEEFSAHNIITWNALLSAHAQHDERRALLLFDRIIWEGMVPTGATFVGLLNAHKNPEFLADGRRLHLTVTHVGFSTNVVVANALINMYSKCGKLTAGQTVFDNMPERDAFSWTTMIGAYGEHGQGLKALKLFKEMLIHTVPDDVTFLNVLTACNRGGLAEDGIYWFTSMSEEYGIEPRGEHYSCLIDLLGRAGRLGEAANLIEKMPVEPSYRAWVTFLGACRYSEDVERAQFAAQYLLENYPENQEPFTLLANIYVKTGRIEDAARLRMMMSSSYSCPIHYWLYDPLY